MSEVAYKEINQSLIEKIETEFNLLIVTATEVEEKVLHENLKPIDGQDKLLIVYKGKQTYYLGKFGAYNTVHVACGEMGTSGATASIVTTTDAINLWHPKAVLMVGIAFGADKKEQSIGDVLVSDVVINYGPRRVGKKLEEPRGKHGAASTLLVNRFKSLKGWSHHIEDRVAQVNIGKVLSGEILIDNKPLKIKLLKENPDAIGGEMEGSGIYAACDQKVNDWILVKGICDYADGNKKKNKKVYQNQAIRSAVSLCQAVFSSDSGFQDIGLHKAAKEIDVEELQKHSLTLENGLPAWMRTHAETLKKAIGNED